MRSVTNFIKRYWKSFDDSLINPPKERPDNKGFKGQAAPKKILGEGPIPNPEQVLYRSRIMDDEELKMQPRALRFRHFMYFMGFAAWYIAVNLFIMYRMKGDDLDSLEKEVQQREKRKREIGV